MSADSPRRTSGSRGIAVPAIVPPQVVSDRSILDSAIGFINDVTLTHPTHTDSKDTITWARFESAADICDPRFGEDWELEGNVAPPLLLILGYGLGVQVWAIPANGEAVEVLTWRHGIVSALRVLPTPTTSSTTYMEDNGRADQASDAYAEKRPLMALVDSSTTTGSQPQFCAVNFVSLKTGTQVKTIKFKNPVLDVLANRSSVVITFHERIAVFDARTLEDRLSVTTCFPSPGINPNPVALGPRWLAYAEHKLLHSKRSGAGCDGDGVASYTATMLNAAKSFGKGLRELGEQVAAGLTGTTGGGSISKNNSFDSGSGLDAKQPGVVTILDVKHAVRDYSPTSGLPAGGHVGGDPIVAHFIAHSEAVVCLEFDNSGMLLVSADRRGHDFHIFRIQPHPVGASLAAVHHLYVLHRGDTSAKVQNIAFSLDSRWVAVSTLRGTTHVFPITPYGGAMGVRTHTSLHVVNKLSRFHRSAGLSAEGRSSSPISHSESTTFVQSLQPYHNPTLPPFPRPTVVLPLAQLRQPFTLGSPPSSAGMAVGGSKCSAGGSSSSSQRQRLSSLSDDNGKPLSVCAIFAKSRSWLLDPPNATREAPHRIQRKAVDSLFVMAGHGALIQYDLDTKLASNVAKEKICDDTPIELEVEAKAQWNLGRRKDGSQEIMPPLSSDNWLVKNRNSCMLTDSTRQFDETDDQTESWLAQVEIITHAGPHRRLWMGPQFVFKTYNTPSGSNLSHVDAEAVEIGISKPTTAATTARAERSSPLNMPFSATARSKVPVLIESGSYSSIEQSPKLMDRFRHDNLDSDFSVSHGDSRLKEDLADAMRESPSVSAAHKDTGRLPSDAASSSDNVPFYDALAEHEHENDDDDQNLDSQRSSSAAALASALPNIYSYDTSSSYESLDSLKKQKASIEKVVNPLGTVTTVTSGMSAKIKTDILDEVVLQLAAEDSVIHENCDEALFRPVVAIFCNEQAKQCDEEETKRRLELCKPPELIGNNLIVPVIAKEIDAELSKKEKQKSAAKTKMQQREQQERSDKERSIKFEELSNLSKKCQKVISGKESADSKVAEDKLAKKIKENNLAQREMDMPETIKTKAVLKETCIPLKEKSKSFNESTKVVMLEEEEKPLEFKRMTPLSVEKPSSPKKNVEKSAIKAQDRDSKSEASDSKIAKSKDKEEQTKNVQVEEKERNLQPVKSPKKSVKECGKSLDKSITKTADAATRAKVNTAVTNLSDSITAQSTEGKKEQLKGTKLDSEKKEEIAKGAKVKTELLNISHLEESLIELSEEVAKIEEAASEQKKTVTKCAEKERKTKDNAELGQLREPVEIFAAPKSSKKKKQKQSKSGSSSEAEEVIEVTTMKSRRKSIESKVEIKPQTNKKSSISTEENYSDLADSLLQNKSKIEDALFLSFTQIEEKSKKATTDAKKSDVIIAAPSTSAAKKDSATSIKKIESIKDRKQGAPDMKNDNDTKKNVVSKDEGEDNKYIRVDKIKVSLMMEQKEMPKQKAPISKPESVARADVKVTNESNIKYKDTMISSNLKEEVKKDIKISKQTLVPQAEKEMKKPELKESKTTTKDDPLKIEKILKHDESVKGLEKTAESKVAIKKEIKKQEYNPVVEENKESLKDKTGSNAVSKEESFSYKISISETTNLDKKVKADTNINTTVDVKIEIPKSHKKNSKRENMDQPEVKAMTTTTATLFTSNDSKTKKSLDDTKLYDVKVITEQPTKTKRDTKIEEKGIQSKEESKEPLEMLSKKKKIEKSTSSSSEDVPDGVGIVTERVKATATTTKPKEVPIVSTPPPASVWKTMSGSEMINKNLEALSAKAADESYPSLQKSTKNKKLTKSTPVEVATQATGEQIQKLLPDFPTPPKVQQDFKEPVSVAKNNAKPSKKSPPPGFDGFPMLKPLESLSPLPTLEPLEVISSSSIGQKTRVQKEANDLKASLSDTISLINFESPLQENPALERKITPPSRGFTEQNLILALCGSLHYENETPERVDVSPTLSLTRSSSALGEQSTADYKSFTENDETYMSLEQSSQETNTTNTATTNEKLSSSPNSSASEEIIIMETKKLSKKQRLKKLQHQQTELQKQGCTKKTTAGTPAEEVDEELRPLIGGMCDSLVDTSVDTMIASTYFAAPATTTSQPVTFATTLLMDDSFTMPKASSSQLGHYATTDSEGPMPATTSDDNACILPASSTTSTPHKLKTKKLEHKINLIAAIEAATSSSSTSSAEESGVEAGGGRSLDSNVALVAVAATPTLPLPQTAVAAQQNATKKKTKRRYTFKSSNSVDSSSNRKNNIDAVDGCKSKKQCSNTDDAKTTATPATAEQQLEQKVETPVTMTSAKAQHSSVTTSTSSTQQQQQLNTSSTDGASRGVGNDVDGVQYTTIVNIEPFDDQLSTSSISTNSHASLDVPFSLSPPLSLSDTGLIDTNLMHFPAGGDSVDEDDHIGGASGSL